MKLTFGKANTKLVKLEKALQKKVITFSLPSGFACPGAMDCLSRANRETGKITDGKNTEFRCFQASAEALYPALRNMVWNNFELIQKLGKNYSAIAELIQKSLPDFFNVCRIHIGGDFFSQAYFDAWIEVAIKNPNKLFYAYTKSLNFWMNRKDEIPANLVLTASRGGKFDKLIDTLGLKCSEVVFSEQEAKDKGLEIDHDDSHAAIGKESFALLIHGTQPAGTPAAAALKLVKSQAKKEAK
jgi:Gene product 88